MIRHTIHGVPTGGILSSLSLLLRTDSMLWPHFRNKETGAQGLAQNKSVLFPPHQQLRLEGILEMIQTSFFLALPPFIPHFISE